MTYAKLAFLITQVSLENAVTKVQEYIVMCHYLNWHMELAQNDFDYLLLYLDIIIWYRVYLLFMYMCMYSTMQKS